MFKTAKIAGLNSDQLAAQGLVVDRQPDTSYFVLLSLTADDAFAKVRQALSLVEDAIDELADQPVGAQLTALENKILEPFKEVEQVSSLIAALHNKGFYILRRGHGVRAQLIRKDQLSDLTKLAPEDQLISGFLHTADRVVLSTNNLQIDELKDLPLENLEDEITPQLSQSQEDPFAVIVLDFGDQPVGEIPEGVVQDHPTIEKDTILAKIVSKIKLPKTGWRHFLPKTRKSGLISGGVLLAVVLVGIAFSYQMRKNQLVTDRFNQSLLKAQDEYNQALALKDLDSVSAKQHLTTAKQELASALTIKANEKSAIELQNQINSNSGAILKVTEVKDFNVWLDLDLVKKNFTTKKLSLSVGKLLVLDDSQKSLVVVDLAKKSNQILAGGEKLGQAKNASLNGDNAFVYSADKGILKIDLPNGGEPKDPVVAIKANEEWGRISDIYGFGGNLYLVDEFKNAIWKYLPTASGYSDIRNYLAGGVKVDFAGTNKMQIDSSVWVMKNDGELFKFTQGVRDFFSFSGLDKPVQSPKSFFVSDETDNLYILDSGNSRLLVLDKKGVYISQYTADQFKNFTDLVVDEEGKKAYLLSGQKIYQIDL